jgi:hypothetical protein
MKVNEAANIIMLIQMGMDDHLVTNPSRKAATMNIGTRPIISFTPSLAPRFKE